MEAELSLFQTVEERVSESLGDKIMRAKNIPLKRVSELQATV